MGRAVGGGEEQDDSGAREEDVRRVLKRATAAGCLCVHDASGYRMNTCISAPNTQTDSVFPQLCISTKTADPYLSLLTLITIAHAVNLEMLRIMASPHLEISLTTSAHCTGLIVCINQSGAQ